MEPEELFVSTIMYHLKAALGKPYKSHHMARVLYNIGKDTNYWLDMKL